MLFCWTALSDSHQLVYTCKFPRENRAFLRSNKVKSPALSERSRIRAPSRQRHHREKTRDSESCLRQRMYPVFHSRAQRQAFRVQCSGNLPREDCQITAATATRPVRSMRLGWWKAAKCCRCRCRLAASASAAFLASSCFSMASSLLPYPAFLLTTAARLRSHT